MKKSKAIAQERQLILESNFLANAIKKIRDNRNALEVENLHLQNMLHQAKHGVSLKPAAVTSTSTQPEQDRISQRYQTTSAFEHKDLEHLDEVEACNQEDIDVMIPFGKNDLWDEESSDSYDESDDDIEDELMDKIRGELLKKNNHEELLEKINHREPMDNEIHLKNELS